MATLRVSGVQMLVTPSLADNLEKVVHYIAMSDCDFIVFPEMSLTGYHGDFSDKAVQKAWRQIGEACRQAYVTAIIGTGAREDGVTFIQSRIMGDNGELIGTHEKLVPTEGDRKFCRPGEELRVFTHHDVTFGCLICNDLWVTPGCGPYPDPRLTYKLGKMGAQVIFHSIHSGGDQTYTSYHESNLVLRAMESKLHIVTANAALSKGAVNASTGLIAPSGEWLAKCPRTGERHFTHDIELETGT